MKQLFKNISWLGIGEVFGKVVVLGVTIIISRKLGVESLGLFNFVISLVGIGAILADFGAGGVLIREGSADRNNVRVIFYNFLFLKAIFTVLFLVFVGLALFVLRMPAETETYIFIYAIFVVFDTLISFTASLYRIYEQYYLEAIVKICSKLFLGIAVAMLMLNGVKFNLQNIFNMYVLSAILGFIISTIIVFKLLKKHKTDVDHFAFNGKQIRKYLSETLLLGISSFLWQVYYRIDTVMLGFMKNEEAVGIYSAAYNVFQIINIIPAYIIAAAYPKLAQLYSENQTTFRKYFNVIYKYLFIAGLIVVIGGVLAARLVPAVYGGHAYEKAIFPLQILMTAFIFLFPTHLLTNTLVVLKKTKIVLYICLIATLFNVVANILIIPRFSYVGTAVTTLMTEFLVGVLCSWYYLKFIRRSHESV